MSRADAVIPVVLFAYARPAHLAKVLGCLRENGVPLMYAFCDGPKGEGDVSRVDEVRAVMRAVDWCDIRLVEREVNMGLGRNVRAGVTEVAERHEAFIVWEDDLICVPGTYAWMCAALRHYASDERVMSVSGWTHPRVTPGNVGERPYFDARADCWVWGAWARSWRGMNDATAVEKMRAARRRGIAPAAYGADLPQQAGYEVRRNVWAVRWLYHHFQHGGLCVRPPWSMVEHIGFDALATNAAGSVEWANPPLRAVPPVPADWPEVVEHPACRVLWTEANPIASLLARIRRRARGLAGQVARRALPSRARAKLRLIFGWRWFRGEYASWAEARAASAGYDDAAIVAKVAHATQEVRAGRAAFERDGVLFSESEPDQAFLTAMGEVWRLRGGERLRVLDFGGSLGTNYWRHREQLELLGVARWDIVEQAGFVAAGRELLVDSPLRFFEDVTSAGLAAAGHDLLICSCVLQYLEEPWRHLEEWRASGVEFLLLNNLPLRNRGGDQIRVQHVPPAIYPASYPVRFFGREVFLSRLETGWEVLKEFESEAVWPVGWGMFPSTGLLLRRKGGA